MASRIKGITIEIGGDTKPLEKALGDVNKRSNTLKSELKDVERLLKFDPGNVEALAQKQKLLSEQVQSTVQKLDALKKAEQQVQDQVKEGKISEQQYRNFRREIEFTEASLKNLKQELNKVNDSSALKDVKKDADNAKGATDDLGSSLGEIATMLAAGGGIGGAVTAALDNASLNTQIDISFNVPESSKKSIKDAVKTIETYGLDAEEALEGVRRQWVLNSTASDKVNAELVKSAAAITKAYSGIDFIELIQEVNEISKSFKISDENAMGLVNSLLKMGFPPEQLDTIVEYGTQLQMAGYTAQEIQAIFAAGIDTKTWNIDNLLDGVKEGRIRMAEFGQEVPKAMTELLKGTEISKKELQAWGEAIAAGGSGGTKAMQDVTTALMGVKDETQRNALGVQIFGTMWEDQGTNIADTILNAKTQVVDLKQGQDELNASVNSLENDPLVKLKDSVNELKIALEPLLSQVADWLSQMADWISENPKLTATLLAVTTGIAGLSATIAILTPIVRTIITLASLLAAGVGAISAPVWIVIGAITALIAIGVALYKNWDTVRSKATTLMDNMSPLQVALLALTGPIGALVAAGVTLYKNWDTLMEKGRKLKETVSNLFKGVNWELPKIKLPHFKLSGDFDLKSLSVPKLSVDWYKTGGLFPANSPQIIGVGDHPTAEEAVLPLSDAVLGKIASMIASHMGGGGGNTFNFYPQQAVINEKDIVREFQRMEALYNV